ncbi:hypothetical protein D1007_15666 [Hordeum vulgare]|nr:hypothetical protein D1007_15666 [Hordeum vulgare]
MVRKNFNVPSGSRAVGLLRRNEPHVLHEPYRVGSRAPTRRTIEVLEVADVLDVITIKRAWVLLCISLVLSPGTGNMVTLEYLASLVDMDSINEFSWDEHFLVVALNEVKKYQKKRNEGKTAFWIGGCLAMFAIPSHMIPIYEKHKKLHAREVKKVLKSFGQVLEAMFCKRLASIFFEANATTTSSNDHMPEDVTFHAPTGNAADVNHTRAPIHTSPEAHKSHAPQEVDADKEVAGCSNTNQNEAQRDIGLEKMQGCGFLGMEDVQQGPVLGEREKLVGAEVGASDLKDPDIVDEGQSVILSQGTMAALQGLSLEFDDGPSMSLFKEGTEDFEWLNMGDDTARNPNFIEIEGFHTSLENFHASLKPRAEIDSDIMTLYLKTFNLEQMYNKKKRKKFAFSVFMGLFIVVVQNIHWVVVAANLMHKQFNVFDSTKNSEDVTLLMNATNNVITNIKKVANCESAFKFDLNCFEIVTPDYPTQGTQ